MTDQTTIETIRGKKNKNGNTDELCLPMEPIVAQLGIDRSEAVWMRVLAHDSATIIAQLFTERGTMERPNGRRATFENGEWVELIKLSPNTTGYRRVDISIRTHIPEFEISEYVEMSWSGNADELILTTHNAIVPASDGRKTPAPRMKLPLATQVQSTTLVGLCRFTAVERAPKLSLPNDMLAAMGYDEGDQVRFSYEVRGTALVIEPRLYTGKECPADTSTFSMKENAKLTISDVAVDDDRTYPVTLTKLTDRIWVITVNLA